MRYELSETEWNIIRAMLPTKPRGVPRVDDRRVSMASFGCCDGCSLAGNSNHLWPSSDELLGGVLVGPAGSSSANHSGELHFAFSL